MSIESIDDQETDLLIEIRRFIRAVDKHSTKLAEKHGVTVAQLVVLQELKNEETLKESVIGNRLDLSKKVVREIIDRLVRIDILKIEEGSELESDRIVSLAEAGYEILSNNPALLQNILLEELKSVDEWQKNMILASFQRMNNLIEAEDIRAAPIIATGDITEPEPTPETDINRVLRPEKTDIELVKVESLSQLEKHISSDELAKFLCEHMEPFDDSTDYTKQGIKDSLTGKPDKGGFIILAKNDGQIVGALVMLATGMKNYIPGYCLLFIGVDSSERGAGIGQQIMNHALEITKGDVYLHVEENNPAKRLYERMGFKHTYAEMRYYPTEVNT